MAIAIAAREGSELGQMVLAVESESDQSVADHGDNEGDVSQRRIYRYCWLCGVFSARRAMWPPREIRNIWAHIPVQIIQLGMRITAAGHPGKPRWHVVNGERNMI